MKSTERPTKLGDRLQFDERRGLWMSGRSAHGGQRSVWDVIGKFRSSRAEREREKSSIADWSNRQLNGKKAQAADRLRNRLSKFNLMMFNTRRWSESDRNRVSIKNQNAVLEMDQESSWKTRKKLIEKGKLYLKRFWNYSQWWDLGTGHSGAARDSGSGRKSVARRLSTQTVEPAAQSARSPIGGANLENRTNRRGNRLNKNLRSWILKIDQNLWFKRH